MDATSASEVSMLSGIACFAHGSETSATSAPRSFNTSIAAWNAARTSGSTPSGHAISATTPSLNPRMPEARPAV